MEKELSKEMCSWKGHFERGRYMSPLPGYLQFAERNLKKTDIFIHIQSL